MVHCKQQQKTECKSQVHYVFSCRDRRNTGKKNEEIDISRQLGVYKQKQEEFHELKNKIIELKVKAEDSDLLEVEAWRKEVENSIKEVEQFVVKLNKH